MSLVPDVVLIFNVNGKRKELHYRKLPFSVWSELKAALAFTPTTLIDSISHSDVEAIGALIWLERKQADRKITWNDIRRELEREDVTFEALGVVIDGQTMVGEETPTKEPDADPTGAV